MRFFTPMTHLLTNQRWLMISFVLLAISCTGLQAQVTIKVTQDIYTDNSLTTGQVTPSLLGPTRERSSNAVGMSYYTDNMTNNTGSIVNYIGEYNSKGFADGMAALKFTLPPSAGVLVSAKLNLYIRDIVGSPTLTIRSTDDNAWVQENTADSYFALLINPTTLISSAPVSGLGTYKSFDITSYIASKMGATSNTISLILTGNANNNGNNYFSFIADDNLVDLTGGDPGRNTDVVYNPNAYVAKLVLTYKPEITSATYDANTGVLVLTCTNITAGDAINPKKITLTGEGGATYTLTTANTTASNTTTANITLNATDKAAVNLIFNKIGTSSTGNTSYNVAAADDWDASITDGDISDLAGNGVTVSNVPVISVSGVTAGGLSAAIIAAGSDLATVTSLTVTGNIDARDFKTMRDAMPNLAVLDLSGATIVAGTNIAGTAGTMNYPANGIPSNAFSDGFMGKTSLTSFSMPSTITSIGGMAFNGCSYLTGSLTIPASVNSIGFMAFGGCSMISSIKAYGATPCSGLNLNVFAGIVTSTCILHVPFGTKALYAAADQWKAFIPNIVEDLGFAPTVNTSAATSVSSTGAILNGDIAANNASTAVTFEYGLTTSYGTIVTADQSPVTGTLYTAVSYALTGLTPNTIYHYRLVGANAEGTTNGADMTFITNDIAPNISYVTPQTYTVGTPIAALTPTNAGGAVVAASQVSTLAVSGASGSGDGLGTAASIPNPYFLATDAAGNLYVSDFATSMIHKITPAGGVSTLADASAGFNQPSGIAVDPSGNVYVADSQNNRIRKITQAGAVSTLAGSDSGESGNANGNGTAARFSYPFCLTLDAADNLYVTDAYNHLIRKITPAGEVSTFAGSGVRGSTDGNGTSASFSDPAGIAIDIAGNVYVADGGNNLIRKISPTGVVSTLAGNGSIGADNGAAEKASFYTPVGLTVDAMGNLYVADGENNLIRKISPMGVVSTLAGNGSAGAENGAGEKANFDLPYGITIDASGNLYVTDFYGGLIRKITQTAYTISPALPAGLSFDGATGTISGTPTAASATTTYTVSAANSAGSSTTILNITVASAPTATTSTATSVSSTGATLNGSINANNASTAVTFEYGLTTSYGNTVTADQSPVTGGTATTVSKAITGLTPGTTYYYRVVGVNAGGTTNGADMTFSTADIAPNISYVTPQIYTVGTPIAALTPTNTGGATPALTSAQVSTWAGSGALGTADGLGTAASFKYPAFLAPDAAGNLYVSDNGNNLIRKITPTGDVSTFAGVSAGFNKPCGIAVDPSGNVYVADNQHHRIRKITPAGVVSTLAGSDSGESGNANGVGVVARFNNPVGLALDAASNLYVVDSQNELIRKITPAGDVTTFAGSGNSESTDGNGTSANFKSPAGIVIDASGNLYVTDSRNYLIRKISQTGDVTTLAGSGSAGAVNGVGTAASFNSPTGIAVDAMGNLYVADAGNNLIRKISPTGVVSTLAGNGSAGENNGAFETASFRLPYGVTVDASGNLYVADTGNNLIRKITQSAYTISPALPAGLSFDGATGTISGTPTAASATTTYTVSAANSGGSSTTILNITVASAPTATTSTATSVSSTGATLNGSINANNVSTAVTFEYGLTTSYGNTVTADQSPVTGTSATVVSYTLTGLTPNTSYHYRAIGVNAGGTTHGADMAFSTTDIAPNISYVTPQTYTVGTPIAALTPTNAGGAVVAALQVSTLAGSGASGSADGLGTAASFNTPTFLVSDIAGNLYVSELGSNMIRKITPAGGVSTLADASAGFNQPLGIAVDPSGNVYVADNQNSRIRKITQAGAVSTLAGSDNGESGNANGNGTAARFSNPIGLTLDAAGNLYVTDWGNKLIRKITSAGEVSTFAGSGASGSANGNGTSASFDGPMGIASDASGNLYVTDESDLIHKITPAGDVTTFAGSGSRGATNGTGTAASFSSPIGSTVDAMGNLYVADAGNNLIRKISPTGVVSTLAGNGSAGENNGAGETASFNLPYCITVDASGNMYVADAYNNLIRKITQSAYTITPALPAGLSFDVATGTISGTPTAASAATTYTVSAANSGGSSTTILNITVASAPTATTSTATSVSSTGATLNGSINANNASTTVTFEYGLTTSYGNTVTADQSPVTGGTATTVSKAITGLTPGTTYYYRVVGVNAEGTTNGGDMTFSTTDIAPNISYVTPQIYTVGTPIAALTPTNTGGAVVAISSPQVSTLAGSDVSGSADGLGTAASFNIPVFLAPDVAGNIYVSDLRNNMIRKITPAGDVSTLANASAGFNEPAGIAVDPSGNVYVAENENHRIRKITPAGVVSTVAGSDSGERGNTNGSGTAARFNAPAGLTLDAAGNLYVSDNGNKQIRKITPAGEVSTFAGSGIFGSTDGNGTSASFKSPIGIVIDASGNLYVADSRSNLIRKISPTGDVSTFAGSGAEGSTNGNGTLASFNAPEGIAIDASGNLYIADSENNLIRKINHAGDVTTLAGNGSLGADNGAAETASFGQPYGVALDASGNLYVADTYNNLIRKITQSAYTITPALPAGLSFDGATGTISGTPTAASAATTYTVTTANNGGSSTTTFSIAVKNPQIISFGTLASKTYGDATFDLAATSTSGLAVSYSSDNTAVATVSGNTVTIVGAGTTNITASQVGDAVYAPAANVTQQLSVIKRAITLTADAKSKTYGDTDPGLTAQVTSGTIVTGDNASGSLTRAAGETVTDYSIGQGTYSYGSNYTETFVSANLTIGKRAITLTAPTVTLSKLYDGNTLAAVTIGTLSGVMPSDDGKVTITAQASYDNATVGTNKTITVAYTLGGSAAGNYSAPADVVVTGAEISSGTITLEPLSNPAPNAANTGLVLSYNVVAGGPTQYQITFETAALAVGIQNVSYTALVTTGANGNISISVPEGTRPGKYKGTLQMRNDSGVESAAYDFVLTVNIPTEYIAVKYNRVLVLDNSTRIFSAYQWYKDGVAIEGATKQFYRDPKGLVGTYMIQATTTDGEILYSYPKVLNIPIALKVTAYPTMVKPSQTCTVEITDEAMGLDLTGAELSVYSTQGIRVYHSTKVENLNTIKLPIMNGVYSGRVTTADGQSFLFKVIVAN